MLTMIMKLHAANTTQTAPMAESSIGPAPQAVTKNSKVEHNMGRSLACKNGNICLDMRSSS